MKIRPHRNAFNARTAKERAEIAAELLTGTKPARLGDEESGPGRNFDDCFECNDGDEVLHHLLNAASVNPELREAIKCHRFETWLPMIPDKPQPFASEQTLMPLDAA